MTTYAHELLILARRPDAVERDLTPPMHRAVTIPVWVSNKSAATKSAAIYVVAPGPPGEYSLPENGEPSDDELLGLAELVVNGLEDAMMNRHRHATRRTVQARRKQKRS